MAQNRYYIESLDAEYLFETSYEEGFDVNDARVIYHAENTDIEGYEETRGIGIHLQKYVDLPSDYNDAILVGYFKNDALNVCSGCMYNGTLEFDLNTTWGAGDTNNIDMNGTISTYYVQNEAGGEIPVRYGVFNRNHSTIEIDVNFPIFETEEQARNHIQYGSMLGCLNLNTDANENTKTYYIYNTYDSAVIKYGEIESYTGGNPTGRFLRFKANQTPYLYYVDKENSCELGLLARGVVASKYSSIYKYAVENADLDTWTPGSLAYSGPFYQLYSFLPDGTHTVGVTLDRNVMICDSREQAVRIASGLEPEEAAEDYGQYTSGNLPKTISNQTGTKITATVFGGNESETVFSHDYTMDRSTLADIGGKFFDSSIINALLEGLKVYGNDPMQSVLSCIYFPFDLSTISTGSTVSSIYFGSYKMENISGTVRKIQHVNGYKELGETYIKPTYRNFLDYTAVHLYLYLPYIGFVELDVNKYMEKTLKIIYMVDIHSGECEVSLCADGLLMDTYSGQIGIKQAITWQDLSTYFQSQITALRNGVMSVVGGPVAGAGTGAQMGSSGGPYGMLAGAVAGASVGQMVGNASGMWQGWKVSHTKPPLFSKGGYSSEIGANMPQYAFIVFMYNDVEIPDNLVELYGKPSNISGRVGSFSGFLSCNYVQLQCPTATDEEKNEIVSLLHSGIYI